MNYRILERAEHCGSTCFYPQNKKFFFWFNYWEFEVFPKPIKFFSLEEAKVFLKKQIKKPKDKIHYIQ
jgi:hypothetical protein